MGSNHSLHSGNSLYTHSFAVVILLSSEMSAPACSAWSSFQTAADLPLRGLSRKSVSLFSLGLLLTQLTHILTVQLFHKHLRTFCEWLQHFLLIKMKFHESYLFSARVQKGNHFESGWKTEKEGINTNSPLEISDTLWFIAQIKRKEKSKTE